MRLDELVLRNFRNISALEIHPGAGINIFTGENGSGKTNIAEAIYFLNIGQSFRARKQDDVIQWENPAAVVRGTVVNRTTSEELAIQVTRPGKKLIRRNQKAVPLRELIAAWNVVMFSPDDTGLIRGAPVIRRRFLDVWLSRAIPEYYDTLRKYWLALQQRNALLQRIRQGRHTGELGVWDQQLANWGAKLIFYRDQGIRRCGPLASAIFRELHGMAELTMQYRTAIPRQDSQEAIHSAFAECLQKAAVREKERGITLVGPHRDEVELQVNGHNGRYFCSSGEQRLLALALRLMEYQSLQQRGGESPVLVLDDIFSELDVRRRQQVLRQVGTAGQCFITAVDTQQHVPPETVVFSVASGGVTKHG